MTRYIIPIMLLAGLPAPGLSSIELVRCSREQMRQGTCECDTPNACHLITPVPGATASGEQDWQRRFHRWVNSVSPRAPQPESDQPISPAPAAPQPSIQP